ncbi:flagellar hook-basal body complex protein [Acidisoma sp. 7E03]
MSMDAYYTAMAGLQAIGARMDALSANLANIQTTGYQAVQAMTEAAPYVGGNAPSGADVVALTPGPNTQPGALVKTGDPLNLGLGGDAWLAVQTPRGLALTRDGALQLSVDGLLTDSRGNPVLGANGAPVSLPALSSMTIGSDGTISGISPTQPGQTQSYGQIFLVATPPGTLTALGGALFAPPDPNRLQPATKGSVAQGYLNGSNVDPVRGMVDMIDANRSYQLQTQLMKSYASDSSALNTLLAQG